jgi:hypothetical protein
MARTEGAGCQARVSGHVIQVRGKRWDETQDEAFLFILFLSPPSFVGVVLLNNKSLGSQFRCSFRIDLHRQNGASASTTVE